MGAVTNKTREEAARWVRENARKHAGKTGQSVSDADREVGKVLREGDRREKETGKR